MVRVAHISDCFVPRLGGIEMQVNDLTRRQQQAGLQPEVITATPLPRRMGGRQFPVPVHRYGHSDSGRDRQQPDAVPAHRKGAAPGQFRRWCTCTPGSGRRSPRPACGSRLELGLPVTVTVHCLPAAFRLPSWLIPWGTPEIARRIALNAVSEAAAAPAARRRPGERSPWCPTGWTPQDWAVEPADHDPGVVHAVSTMRLSVRKRPLQLLGAVRAAQQQLGLVGLPAADRLRRRQADAPDAPVHRPQPDDRTP